MASLFDIDCFQETLGRLGRAPVQNVICHQRIDSTSSDLRRRLENGARPGAVVVALQQTAGRGRSGREWYSEPGRSLSLSISLELAEATGETVPMVPLAAGVAAADAVRESSGVRPLLKWPNDLMAEGRKVGGILTEMVAGHRGRSLLIVGLGINIATAEFPPELAGIAVSLAQVSDTPVDGSFLAGHFVAGLQDWVERISSRRGAELVAAWRERAEPFGRRVRVGDVSGVTRDIAPDGRLLVAQDDGGVVSVVGGIVEDLERA